LQEKNNLLFKKRNDIWNKSLKWINVLENEKESIQNKILLSQIYYLRLMSNLEYEDAEMACEFFCKIPFEYFTDELLMNYISCLKLCYKFNVAVEILKSVIRKPVWFRTKYWCLLELVDSGMVADGVITNEEYIEYKNLLIGLLEAEKESVEQIIP